MCCYGINTLASLRGNISVRLAELCEAVYYTVARRSLLYTSFTTLDMADDDEHSRRKQKMTTAL